MILPEQLEEQMSEGDARRWLEYYTWRNHRWERLEWMIGQLTAVLSNAMRGTETEAGDWIPQEAADDPGPVKLSDHELAMQLALSMGAKVIYKGKEP